MHSGTLSIVRLAKLRLAENERMGLALPLAQVRATLADGEAEAVLSSWPGRNELPAGRHPHGRTPPRPRLPAERTEVLWLSTGRSTSAGHRQHVRLKSVLIATPWHGGGGVGGGGGDS